MTTAVGNISDSYMLYEFGGYSNLLQPGNQAWRLPYIYGAPAPMRIGPKTNTQPITENPVTGVGYKLSEFVADYYYRIHILPSVIALGSVLGTQTRAVEVWNAYFEPHAFNTLEVTNAGGTTLDPTGDTAPTTIAILRSLKYVLTVNAAGPASIDASYKFGFDIGDFFLKVTGTRTAIFAFQPNWANPVIEKLKWLTYVMTSVNGKEQRIARRLIPRRTFEFTVDSYLENYQYLDSLLTGWQNRIYAFPVWPDADYLQYELAPGQSFITCDTANRDYTAGSYAIITTGPTKSEAVQIATVDALGITLVKPNDKAWPVDAKIAPARLGRLATEVTANKTTARIAHLNLVFDIEDNTNVAAVPESGTYRGGELVLRRPNRAEDVTVLYKRLQDRMDNDEGVIDVEDRVDRNFTIRSYEFVLKDRADLQNYRKWLHVRQGQLKPFWMPVWEMNIDIIKPTTAVDTSFTMRANGYTALLQIDASRRHVAMLHKNGNWVYRQVLQYGPGDNDDEEVAYLDGVVGYASQPGDWVFVTFIEYAVGNADEIEIAYLKDDAAVSKFATRSVIQ